MAQEFVVQKVNLGAKRLIGTFSVFSGLMFCLFLLTAFSDKDELEILKRACEKALGVQTTDGAPRIINLERSVARREDTLLVNAHAQPNITQAGLRNNALTDVATILRVAKSWGWADKVGRIAIIIFFSRDGSSYPLLSCSVSHDALAEVDWSLVKPKAVAEHLDDVKYYEVKK